MSPAAFKDLVNDIAVTCRMHPTSLGVDPDETGEVYLGKDINLKVFRAENVFTVDPEKPKFRKVASPSPIPSRVLRIKVEGDLRAVIVVEHKNLATQMSLIERGLTDVMIIKVQFYFWFHFGALHFGWPIAFRRKASRRCPQESSFTCSGCGSLPLSSFCTCPTMTGKEQTYSQYWSMAASEVPGRVTSCAALASLGRDPRPKSCSTITRRVSSVSGLVWKVSKAMGCRPRTSKRPLNRSGTKCPSISKNSSIIRVRLMRPTCSRHASRGWSCWTRSPNWGQSW